MDITAEVVDAFRSYYPEFHSASDWTAATLTSALTEADEETGARWGRYNAGIRSLKRRGMFAYAAHKAVMRRAARSAVETGGIAPAPAQVASKGVGDESVSYAVATPTTGEASRLGDLRSTIYGSEFLRLRHRAGMGAMAV